MNFFEMFHFISFGNITEGKTIFQYLFTIIIMENFSS